MTSAATAISNVEPATQAGDRRSCLVISNLSAALAAFHLNESAINGGAVEDRVDLCVANAALCVPIRLLRPRRFERRPSGLMERIAALH